MLPVVYFGKCFGGNIYKYVAMQIQLLFTDLKM